MKFILHSFPEVTAIIKVHPSRPLPMNLQIDTFIKKLIYFLNKNMIIHHHTTKSGFLTSFFKKT